MVHSAGDWVIWAAAVLGAVVAIVTVTRPIVKASWRVYHELTPNGGTSIRDAVSRIEVQLAVGDQRRRIMLSGMTGAFIDFDRGGQCTWTSHGFNVLMRTHTDDCMGSGWLGCVGEDDRERVWEEWRDCVAQGRTMSVACDTRGGRAYFKAHPLKCREGEVQEFFGSVFPGAEPE